MMGGMSGQPTEVDSRGADTGPGPSPPNPYGLFATADGLGGVAAPLLAGFAITMVALVVQIADEVRWPDVSLVLLGAAAVLLLQVVQLNARARGYAVTPNQAREWYADIEQNPARLRVVNWELRHHMACWRDLVRRARARYYAALVTAVSEAAEQVLHHLLDTATTIELSPAAAGHVDLNHGGRELRSRSARRPAFTSGCVAIVRRPVLQLRVWPTR